MNLYKPYEDQVKFIQDIGKAFRNNRRVVAQAATGFGKTICIVDIVKKSIFKGNVICIACHRLEIFQQTFKILISQGITPGLISAGSSITTGHQVYLSMCETFYKRMSKGLTEKLNINFFILDEFHLANYYKIVSETTCHVLGFTATPKTTGSPELKEYTDTIVCGPSVKELIKLGRLVPSRTFSVDYDFSKVKKKGQDYDDKALFAEFKKPKLWEGAINSFIKNASSLQALCFCVNVEHSQATALQFREKGFKAAHVDGKTDKETRDRIFQMYRDGDIQIICNVGIATTGTDLPDTGCVIQNFASQSLVKVKQVTGRGGRCADGKTQFIDIDMGRNYIRHGTFDEDINWEHIYENPSLAIKKKDRKDKRECEECGSVIRLHLRQCPYCGDILSQGQIEAKILKGADTSEIRAYRLQQVPPELRKPTHEMSFDELVQYGRIMGHKLSWPYTVMTYRKKKQK